MWLFIFTKSSNMARRGRGSRWMPSRTAKVRLCPCCWWFLHYMRVLHINI